MAPQEAVLSGRVHVVLGVGMQIFLARLGLASSYPGVIVAHTVLCIPFVIVSVSAALQGIDPSVERAAGSLGASPATVFRRVTLPLAMPGVVSGAVFAFATSLDEVVITLFVFSDDIYWAQANLKLDAPTVFVGHNRAERNYEDLRLMSACRHFIIANSSFSWWAAWLGTAQDKLVYAPARWLNHGLDTRDLIPPGWTQVRY